MGAICSIAGLSVSLRVREVGTLRIRSLQQHEYELR
jgi:hypothetical protein